eukprot:gene3884-7097_t
MSKVFEAFVVQVLIEFRKQKNLEVEVKKPSKKRARSETEKGEYFQMDFQEQEKEANKKKQKKFQQRNKRKSNDHNWRSDDSKKKKNQIPSEYAPSQQVALKRKRKTMLEINLSTDFQKDIAHRHFKYTHEELYMKHVFKSHYQESMEHF